jgi:hypothetical protein
MLLYGNSHGAQGSSHPVQDGVILSCSGDLKKLQKSDALVLSSSLLAEGTEAWGS